MVHDFYTFINFFTLIQNMHSYFKEVKQMIINLDDYRKNKTKSKKCSVAIPVYEKIFLKGNKLIGEFSSGRTEVICDYSKNKK